MGSRESEIATRESAAAGVAAAAEERRREAEGWESRMRKVGLESISMLSHIRHRGKCCGDYWPPDTLCGLAATTVDQLLHSRVPMVVLKLCRLVKFGPVCGADGVGRATGFSKHLICTPVLCVMSWFLQELNDKEAQLMRLEGDLRATESELNNRWAHRSFTVTPLSVVVQISG